MSSPKSKLFALIPALAPEDRHLLSCDITEDVLTYVGETNPDAWEELAVARKVAVGEIPPEDPQDDLTILIPRASLKVSTLPFVLRWAVKGDAMMVATTAAICFVEFDDYAEMMSPNPRFRYPETIMEDSFRNAYTRFFDLAIPYAIGEAL